MGPVATGLGEVFHYVVTGAGNDVTELRTIHDWVIKPKLRTVPGAAEINSWGGYEKQYQVRIDPEPADQARPDVRRGRAGRRREQPQRRRRQHPRRHAVGARPRPRPHDQRRADQEHRHHRQATACRSASATWPTSTIGSEIRRGAVTADGKGEVVLGLGFMLMGENTHDVTWAMKNRLDEIKATLPPNVDVKPVYDRTELVDHVIDTVQNNLFEGGLLVIAVLFAFLGNLRAALIVALAIPLSMLFAFCRHAAVRHRRQPAEPGRDRLRHDRRQLGRHGRELRPPHRPRRQPAPLDARRRPRRRRRGPQADDVRRADHHDRLPADPDAGRDRRQAVPADGADGDLRPGRLDDPVADADAGAGQPASCRGDIDEREPLLMRIAHRIHAPVLRFSMHHKALVIGFAACVLFVAFGMIAPNLGSEFVPRLSEGAIAISVVRLTGTDLDDSIRYNTQMEKAVLAAFPDEVEHVWSRIGTAEIATDPMGVELTDMFITLKPRDAVEESPRRRPS